jgi:hypothetical protein
MRITLISHDNWGYNNNIAVALKKKGHVVHHIDFSTFKYKYPNFGYKVYNFFLKAFFKRNLKNIHFGKEIVRRLEQLDEIQDAILTIKGDWIDPKQVLELKKYTKKSIAYFNDNIYRCPKILKVIPNFDEVYSFEKEDCEKHNLKFMPNWIYQEENQEIQNNTFDYDVFNISSKDNRFKTICKVADELKKQNIKSKIIIYDKKNKNKNYNIEFISNYIQIADVKKHITRSKILLDIHRKEQNGLTFRVFESLGMNKKLITTNPDIINYDFYNPNNIHVIDEENIRFDAEFFNVPYEPIPEDIYNNYTLDNMLNIVFGYKK